MIIDSPIIYQLTDGQPLRRPTEEDTVLLVPPSIQPVLHASLVIANVPSFTIPMETSFLVSQLITRTNQAAIVLPIATLGRGLWELELTIASAFNYDQAPGATDRVELTYTLFTFIRTLLARIIRNGSHGDRNRLRILLPSPVPLDFRIPLTGVGQTIDSIATINAIRVI